MSSSTPPPSMSHSPRYYENNAVAGIAPFPGRSTPPQVQPPPAVLTTQKQTTQQYPPDQSRSFENSRTGKGSVSSENTASTSRSPSVQKIYSPKICSPTFSLSSYAEHGSLDHRSDTSNGRPPTRHDPRISHMAQHQRREMIESDSRIYTYIPQEETGPEPKDHAVWVLIWLSLFDPIYSILSALWALFVILPLAVMAPIGLCRPTWSVGDSAIGLLSPMFQLHMRLLAGSSADRARAHALEYRAMRLILVQFISPILSIGVAVAAWIAASFWVFALIMGNPDGTERRDDGRATVLAVRNWWESFFLYSVK